MKILNIVLFTLITSVQISLAQNYSPLILGSKKWFKMNNSSYTREVLKNTVKQNGKEYFQSKTKYSWGDETIVLKRMDENGNTLYLDPKSKTESIDFPSNPELGFSWKSADGAWQYEIFKLGEPFITPNNKFENCLIIKAEQLTNRDKNKLRLYYNYYTKGIGYVGSKNKSGLMSWMMRYKKK